MAGIKFVMGILLLNVLYPTSCRPSPTVAYPYVAIAFAIVWMLYQKSVVQLEVSVSMYDDSPVLFGNASYCNKGLRNEISCRKCIILQPGFFGIYSKRAKSFQDSWKMIDL